MKVEITKAQLIAITEITDECSAQIGCGEPEHEKTRVKNIRLIDNFLKKNGFKRIHK